MGETRLTLEPAAAAGLVVAAFAATWPGLVLELNHPSGEFYKGSGHDPLGDEEPLNVHRRAAAAFDLVGTMTQRDVEQAIHAELRIEPLVFVLRDRTLTHLGEQTLDAAAAAG